MALSIKLNAFEGPLDLLLHLIDKNKMDIFDIPISEITDQYMEYLHAMEKEDLGIMSEFLVMAATLLDIKCRMLLPKETDENGEEEDPRSELVERLLEYKMYKYMSYELKDCMDQAEGIYYKKADIPREVLEYRESVDPAELLQGITLDKLNDIFQAVLKRREDKQDPIRSKFGKIEKEEISMSDKMLQLRDYCRDRRHFSFRSLLNGQKSKFQLVVSFLCILELMKMGHIRAEQPELGSDIDIHVIDNPEEWTNLTEFAEEDH